MMNSAKRSPLLIASLLASLVLHLVGLNWFFNAGEKSSRNAIAIEYRKGARAKTTESETRHTAPAAPIPAETAVAKENKSPTQAVLASRPGDGAVTSGESETSEVLGSSLGLRTDYPRLSRLTGEEGTCVISVHARPESPPVAMIALSSGKSRLDEAALRSTRDGLERGLLKDALAHRSDLKIRFRFELTAHAP